MVIPFSSVFLTAQTLADQTCKLPKGGLVQLETHQMTSFVESGINVDVSF